MFPSLFGSSQLKDLYIIHVQCTCILFFLCMFLFTEGLLCSPLFHTSMHRDSQTDMRQTVCQITHSNSAKQYKSANLSHTTIVTYISTYSKWVSHTTQLSHTHGTCHKLPSVTLCNCYIPSAVHICHITTLISPRVRDYSLSSVIKSCHRTDSLTINQLFI